MRLKSLTDAPPGIGWRFPTLKDKPPVVASSYRRLVKNVKNTLINNNAAVPEDLEAQIQDWLCSNSLAPCWYSDGLGDRIAGKIHAVAKAADKILGTKLERKARGCSGCGRRRKALNKLS